jgi:hypothetical protein
MAKICTKIYTKITNNIHYLQLMSNKNTTSTSDFLTMYAEKKEIKKLLLCIVI